MSYLVLARKWRPQTFGEVVGQDHVTRTLQNAIKQERLAHALIFSGARGVGKTSIARIVAKAINCDKGPGPEPCNQCVICQGITKGTCVDVLEIDGASNRGIDEIRHLRENIAFQPVQCRFKVYIIDEVHMLTREAFNALLKTLEEPPRHVYFIFATTEASKIPETIRSRCQHYEFRLLTPTEIASHLAKICRNDSLGLEPAAIDLISRAAQGSIRDSLSLLDQVVAYGASTLEEVHQALGIIPTQLIADIAMAVLEGRAKDAILHMDNAYRHGADLKKLAQDLLVFLRDLMLLKEVGQDAKDLFLNPYDELKRFKSEALDQDIIKESIWLLARSMDLIARSNTPRLLLETTIIRICQLKEIVRIDHIIEKLRSIIPQGASPPNEHSAKFPAPSLPCHTTEVQEEQAPPNAVQKRQAQAPLTKKGPQPKEGSKEPQGFVSYLLGCLEGENRVLFSYIQEGLKDVHLADDGTLRLLCNNPFVEKMLQKPAFKEELKSRAKDYFGQDLKVDLTCSAGVPSHGGSVEDHGPQRKDAHAARLSLQDELKQHPLVQEAIKVFGARVENVEIFRS